MLDVTAYIRYGKHHGKAEITSRDSTNLFSGVGSVYLDISLPDVHRALALIINAEGNWEIRFTDINGDYHQHEIVKAKE